MIADHYLQLRSELETALAELLKLGTEMRRPAAALDTLHGLLADVREPLLFVVVGEVKAGKSSLLNALFGYELARVDVLPATDRVYIFRHGPDEKTVEVSPQLTERYLPIGFLRDFNVVDTPGTNTMVAAHQTITENFIPRADLVLFVFSVANPWTQSAWELLNLVQKKWLKNVVFVLQQADLRDPAEIDIIQRHLQDTAMQKLGFVPPIFAVSARRALSARSSAAGRDESLWQESGLGPLEEQIGLIVAESSARMLKLRSVWQTARVILDETKGEVQGSFDVILKDEARINRVDLFLHARKEQTLRQVVGLLRGVEQACRESAAEGVPLLEKKLSYWQMWRIMLGRDQWQRDFQKEMEVKLRRAVEAEIEHAVRLLETDLRGLWPQLRDMLDTHLASELQTQIPKTMPDFARQRRELIQSIQLALAERVSGQNVEERLATLFRETSTRLRVPAGIAAASGLVAVIAAMSSAAVADITGIVAASAAVTGTVMAFTQRKKILNTYQEHMASNCSGLVKSIEQQLAHSIDLFYNEISTAFQPLAAFCTAQRQILEPLLRRAESIQKALEKFVTRLQ